MSATKDTSVPTKDTSTGSAWLDCAEFALKQLKSLPRTTWESMRVTCPNVFSADMQSKIKTRLFSAGVNVDEVTTRYFYDSYKTPSGSASYGAIEGYETVITTGVPPFRRHPS